MRICNECLQTLGETVDVCPICKSTQVMDLKKADSKHGRPLSGGKKVKVNRKRQNPIASGGPRDWSPSGGNKTLSWRVARFWSRSKDDIRNLVLFVLFIGGAFVVASNWELVEDVVSENTTDEVGGFDFNLTPPSLVPERLNPLPEQPGQGDWAGLSFDDLPEEIGYRFDPCRQIPYILHEDVSVSNIEWMVTQAFQDVEGRTGLDFEYKGRYDLSITEFGSESNLLLNDDRPFDGIDTSFRPVVVHILETEDFMARVEAEGYSDAVGLGGPNGYEIGDELVSVTGDVFIDGEAMNEFIALGYPAEVLATMRHEVAHVVGLGHVDNPNELMYGDVGGYLGENPTDFQVGDKYGLWQVGAAECLSRAEYPRPIAGTNPIKLLDRASAQ